MSNVFVCFKCSRQVDGLRIAPDLSVDISGAKYEVGEYDMRAIEAAVDLARQGESDAIGLTFGVMNSKAPIIDAGARGLKEVVWVNDPASNNADGFVTARVLAAVIQKLGSFNAIVCAEGAADTYAHQTAPRLAAILDLPLVSNVVSMQIEKGFLVAVRQLRDMRETVEVSLPAVVSVKPEVHEAVIPGMKAILNAKKMPVEELDCAALSLQAGSLEPKTRHMALKGYAAQRKKVVFDGGTLVERVDKLVDALVHEGVI